MSQNGMYRTDLSEKQWRGLELHLPGNPRRGHPYVDYRRVFNGTLWRLKTGVPWRDIPARYGPWQTCYDRFVRWSRDGTGPAGSPISRPYQVGNTVFEAAASVSYA